MNILVTGGAGFLGVCLARALLGRGTACGRPIARLTLLDRAAPPTALTADPRVSAVTGDLAVLLAQGRALPVDTDLVFHLAAAVSAECEQDFDLGMRSNLHVTHLLLEACRARARVGSPPRLVFASSVAVYGGRLPAAVGDDTLPQPQSSYGIQKFVGEQLVADYGRKAFVDGRSVRLMTVSVRPGLSNGAASGFLSGIVREPLAGLRAVCPVAPETEVALSTPARSVDGLLAAADAEPAAWGSRTAMNLPALTVRVADMVADLERVAGPAATALIDWVPDADVQRIVGGWPSRIAADRAQALGLRPDTSFEDAIRGYVREHRGAVALPVRS